MAKSVKLQEVAIDLLRPYERNAKMHPSEQVERIKRSIDEFGFVTPCVIDGEYNLIAGHGRVQAAKEMGMKSVPCVFVEGLTEAQRKAYILADNRLGELGEWDMELVFDELDDLGEMGFDLELTGFETEKDWFENRKRFDNDTDESDEYREFIEKFEQKRTTDDCYTPDLIYDTVCEWVVKTYKVDRKNFVRPFYPGGDYQNEKYSENCIVVDNPPFSIMSEIVNFYVDKGIRFFLFAPCMTIVNYINRAAAISLQAPVTYENGAIVPTSFLTNLEDKDVAIRTAPELRKKLDEANKAIRKEMTREIPKYSYPDNVVTAAMMGKWSKYGIDQTFYRKDCMVITELDEQKEEGKAIYGRGLLLNTRAAAERAAAERAAAERAAAHCWKLSNRELEIVRGLDNAQ